MVVYVVVEILEAKRGEPLVPARGHGSPLVVVEVLAQECGTVAGIVEARGQVVLLMAVALVALPPSIGSDIGPDARIVRVLAAHDGGPTGAAQRVGDVSIREAHTLLLQEGA